MWNVRNKPKQGFWSILQIAEFHTIPALLCGLALCTVFTPECFPQNINDFFSENCLICHTVGGGPLIGPDLKDVTKRKDREWLVKFLLNPEDMVNKGDPYALKIQQEAGGAVMPAIGGMDRARAEAILDLLEEESNPGEPPVRGNPSLSDRPFAAQDVIEGRKIFLGIRKLANGGPACNSCHTMKDLGGLGGGKLGPDMTQVYQRLGGRKNLANWLLGFGTTTMQPVFRNHPLQPEEILPLVAFFEDSAQKGSQDDSPAWLYFSLLALGGTVLGLVACDLAWRHRLRAVRRFLVQRKTKGEKA